MGKSMFGEQSLASRRSSPNYGFGSSTRAIESKRFIGSEHAKTSLMPVSPGPNYEMGSSVSPSFSTRAASPAMWQFGTAERFSHRSGKRSPGPGAYENPGAFGRQGLSNRSTFPKYGFGTVDRDMAAKVFISPSHNKSFFGLQVLCTARSNVHPMHVYTCASGD